MIFSLLVLFFYFVFMCVTKIFHDKVSGVLSLVDRHLLTGTPAAVQLGAELSLLLASPGQPDLVNGHGDIAGHTATGERSPVGEEEFVIQHFTGPVRYHHSDFIGKTGRRRLSALSSFPPVFITTFLLENKSNAMSTV